MSIGIIVEKWHNTWRFLIIVTFLFCGLYFIVSELSENTEFKIDYTNDKALVTIIDKKFVAANSVLPGCDCWTNTGIEIWPGENYQIKISGKIHTVADKLIRDTESDDIPRFKWIDAGGADFRIRNDKEHFKSDNIRKSLLLSQQAKMGQVLLYFKRGDSRVPNCDLGLGFNNPSDIIIYDSEKGVSGTNDTKEKWYVQATVNDMLIRKFDEPTMQAYLGGAIGDTLKRKKKNWKKIVQNNYNRIWFDDNFGSFVISAKIEKPKNIFGY